MLKRAEGAKYILNRLADNTTTSPWLEFIRRWENSGAAERANYQLFLLELCDLVGVTHPEPATAEHADNAYVFERAVTFHNPDGSTSIGRIDLYKRDCFILEAKQGVDASTNQPTLFRATTTARGIGVRGTQGWDIAMIRARTQAEHYARALPHEEGWPPFLVVVDVGHVIELFANFARDGKAYLPYPDPRSHRIFLKDLVSPDVCKLLHTLWTDPLSLDPTRVSAKVTRQVASQLAELAKQFETRYEPERVAGFLMRCIFTSFAEDVHLLREHSWTHLLESLRNDLQNFVPMVEALWQTMNTGGFSPVLREHVLRFNGGLFEQTEAFPVTSDQLDLLIRAASAEWKDVEPAIFGTLLERALHPAERHRLGAHYTPRAYVERLVMPTVIEPLREDWKAVETAAIALARGGKERQGLDELTAFHRKLCKVRVLDPACGSGNFLYVTLEHLKRLEGEVLDAIDSLGDTQGAFEELGATVDPHQLLGMEVNPRAAIITDLVLWIGYLQWYFRTLGARANPPEPVIKRFHNIENRDALMQWDARMPSLDESGQPRTQWDGRTFKEHPVTGEDVPDESARRTVEEIRNPSRAPWPQADFIVGNPPFIGNWRMRGELGDGYVEALRRLYGEVPESVDYVMYWWHRAAELIREGKARRFGFITTNSIRQTFQRRVLAQHLTASNPASIVFAVPDHPWVDAAEGADVRIAMTVAEGGKQSGSLNRVVAEEPGDEHGAGVTFSTRSGLLHSDLTIGANMSLAQPLMANGGISSRGVSLHGSGFIVTPEQAATLGLGRVPGLQSHIRPYRNGRDLTGRPRNVMVIDLFGLPIERVRNEYPEVFQWLWDRVKPERDHNNRPSYRLNWWIHGEPRREFRPALEGLTRYIATIETSKHRFFVFLDQSVLPDNMLVNIASDDAWILGVLSSRIHVAWALAAGGRLGVGNDPRYNKTRCFEPFPFPVCSDEQNERIRSIAESLDAHRKRQQELHPTLGMTDMYNVLEKLRSGDPLSDRERTDHERGLVSVLKRIHDELDQTVAEAYGWPADLPAEDILFRLVDLNVERTAEEAKGTIRWLRPDYQQRAAAPTQASLAIETDEPLLSKKSKPERKPWPAALPERVKAIQTALAENQAALTAKALTRVFTKAKETEIVEILETLVALGQARNVQGAYTITTRSGVDNDT